ncbi:MAG: imidazoleglycerol-phosphate dehydratase HisB [Nitrospirae bacterium]|nr:imidazoleglycerol-phosphate dehydratase HisB [Candidatus Troglogloeales bacterium]
MRRAKIVRNTKETQISANLNLDGCGEYKLKTPFPFFSHMLSGFAKHGLFDLTLIAKGDTEIDDHHTVEDMGIVLGDALFQALGEKEKVTRFGYASIPLDEALAHVTVDLSGRPYLVYNVSLPRRKIKMFDLDLIHHFFRSLTDHSKINLHINLLYGKDPHHILEAIFKGFGRALHQATRLNPKLKGVASTKGML